MFDSGCWILGAGILGAGYWVLDKVGVLGTGC